jgi:hypothetical protein
MQGTEHFKMSKTGLGIALITVSALGLTACYPHVHRDISFNDNEASSWSDGGDKAVTVADRLDCPDAQGSLQKVSASADGHTCVYRKADDEEVTLSLLALNGQTPRAALTPLETDLAQLVQVHTGSSLVSVDASKGDGADKAKVDMPGLHVDANGDKAKVTILGITINADGDKADIKTGSGQDTATVHAGPGGAEVRAGRAGTHSVNYVYVLAGDHPGASGYRADGYIARGPVAGPLVVGEFKSKDNDRGHHDHDLQELIDRNVHDAG